MEELLYAFSSLMSEELVATTPEEVQNCLEWIGVGEQVCEDRISVLPEELITRIISLIPTKDAVKTMVLSKRWRSIWTVVPKLVFRKRNFDGCGSISQFLNKSMELNKAPMLENLCIQLGSQFPVDAEVGKWVANAADRCVRELELDIQWTAEPTSLPECLYTCKTLVVLNLSGKILVDVPSSVCLPSLKRLLLVSVVYQDEDSLFRLLSSSANALSGMYVKRRANDNVKNFIVKVPSLQIFTYVNNPSTPDGVGKGVGSLVIDSPGLKELIINDLSGDSCLVEHLPNLVETCINVICYLDNKFLRCISSVTTLSLFLTKQIIANFSTIKFSRLVRLDLYPFILGWFRPLMFLLNNCPKLTVLKVLYCPSFSWTNPSSVPECLLFHLKNFECVEYRGGEGEKELVAYILANSKCLENALISVTPTFGGEYKVKKEKELESLFRVSAASQLLFE